MSIVMGVKNTKGENVCMITHNKPLPIQFYFEYEFLRIEGVIGNTLYKMYVHKTLDLEEFIK